MFPIQVAVHEEKKPEGAPVPSDRLLGVSRAADRERASMDGVRRRVFPIDADERAGGRSENSMGFAGSRNGRFMLVPWNEILGRLRGRSRRRTRTGSDLPQRR
jgi:hypothetical protein